MQEPLHRHRDKEKFRHHQNDTFTNLQKRYCPPEQKGSGWVLSEKKSEKELRQELPQKEACRSSFCMKSHQADSDFTDIRDLTSHGF